MEINELQGLSITQGNQKSCRSKKFDGMILIIKFECLTLFPPNPTLHPPSVFINDVKVRISCTLTHRIFLLTTATISEF